MQEYFIHDNGGRPFKVQVFDNHVLVFKESNNNNDDEKQPEYNERVLILDNVQQVFVGHDKRTNNQGHSILIKCSSNHYVHISSCIISFQTTDEIVDYHAPIGNSDVVYDYAVGTKYMYLLAE